MDDAPSPLHAWPLQERPRERLRGLGSAALSARELLALLVGSGNAGRSALGVASALLDRSGGSLRRLATLTPAELESTSGVGPAVAARLAAGLELGRRLAREGPVERPRIRGPRDVYEQCAPRVRDMTQEEFRILLLNSRHALLREVVVTRGVLDGSLVHPREVFRPAIAESAAAVVLVHNHPSGNPDPSSEDREVTRQLAAAGRLIGIHVVDHLIIGDGRWYSFAEASDVLGDTGTATATGPRRAAMA